MRRITRFRYTGVFRDGSTLSTAIHREPGLNRSQMAHAARILDLAHRGALVSGGSRIKYLHLEIERAKA